MATNNSTGESCHTSVDSSTFDYQWTVCNLKLLVQSGRLPNSPYFYPGVEIKGERTRWRLVLEYISSSKRLCVSLSVESQQSKSWTNISESLYLEGGISVTMPKTNSQLAELEKVKSFNFNDGKVGWVEEISSHKLSIDLSESEIELGSSRYTHDDSLTLYCKVKVYSVDQPKHVTSTRPKPSKFDLSRLMNNARFNKVLTDVTLVCGKKEFKVHRVVLASQSEFFKTRFKERLTSDKDNDKVDLSDLTPETLEAMISFMYTGDSYKINKLDFDLLAASEKYGLSALKEVCGLSIIEKKLYVFNAISFLKQVSPHNAGHLRQRVVDFIVANPSVRETKEWKSLEKTDPDRIDILEGWAKIPSQYYTVSYS